MKASVWVTFLVIVIKCLTKTTSGRKGLFRQTVWGQCLSPWERHGGKSVRHLVTLCAQWERESNCWCSEHFLHFIQAGPPAHGMVRPPFRVDLPFSVKHLLYYPYMHIQRCASMMILNPVRMMIENNHDSWRHFRGAYHFSRKWSRIKVAVHTITVVLIFLPVLGH